MDKVILNLSPQRRADQLSIERAGSSLSFNGVAIDLRKYDHVTSPCEWIIGQPVRTEKGWELEIILPHGPAAPEETRFPRPILITRDGPVELPDYGPFVLSRTGQEKERPGLPGPKQYRAKMGGSLSSFMKGSEALDAIPHARQSLSSVITFWAETDILLRTFLASRFGPDERLTSELVSAIRADDRLGTLLKVAASMSRSQPAIDRTQSFLEFRSQVKEFRDGFAHGAWLISPEHSGSIILAKANDLRRGVIDSGPRVLVEGWKLSLTYETWCPEDFVAAEECAIRLRRECVDLTSLFP
jgi:hypothetical protein